MPTDTHNTGHGDAAALIDLYIDGLLPAEQKARFEAAMARDEFLRELVAVQRDMDRVIRRHFAPDVQGITASPSTLSMPAPVAPARPLWFKLAAAVLLGLIGIYTYTLWSGRPRVHPIDAYALESREFRPYEVCENEAQVREFTQRTLGQELIVQPVVGVSLVGWSYDSHVLSDATVSLLARAGDDKIIVYMDRADRDRSMSVDSRDGLRVFRREVGGVVMYEVTPRAEPVVLPAVAPATGPG